MTKYIQPLPETHWLTRWRRLILYGDLPWKWILIAAALLVMVLIFAVCEMLWRGSAAARTTFGFGFLTPTKDPSWDPVNDQFQAWPFIYGTLLTSFTALLIALPISIVIAIFLAVLFPACLRLLLNWLVELLAAIPCVVYGLWVIFV